MLNALLLFVPLAALIIFMLRGTGFGRLLYAVGDNEKAARLSGVKYWQVILALYVVSALLAGSPASSILGLSRRPRCRSLSRCCPRSLRPSSAGRRSSAAGAAIPARSWAR
jgi:ABC-type uncharacterized transport system permease subunit